MIRDDLGTVLDEVCSRLRLAYPSDEDLDLVFDGISIEVGNSFRVKLEDFLMLWEDPFVLELVTETIQKRVGL